MDEKPYFTMEDLHRLLAETNHPFKTSAAVHALKEAIRCDRFTDEDVRAFALRAIEPWL
jgi:hypothetical protein